MLNIDNLTILYSDGTRAVDGAGFTLEAGCRAALIGANGAGKTTLLLGLVGILPPAGGKIYVDGVRLEKKSLRDIRLKIGLVFQNPDDQLFMPNIFEDVAFGPRNSGCDEKETAERVNAALARLNIAHLAERSPLKLSGGEKRLAAIAAVIATDPAYLLFDEPTAYLDPKARRGLAEVIRSLPQGILVATHDLAFAETVCPRVLLLQDGRLASDGDVSLLRDAETLEAAGL